MLWSFPLSVNDPAIVAQNRMFSEEQGSSSNGRKNPRGTSTIPLHTNCPRLRPQEQDGNGYTVGHPRMHSGEISEIYLTRSNGSDQGTRPRPQLPLYDVPSTPSSILQHSSWWPKSGILRQDNRQPSMVCLFLPIFSLAQWTVVFPNPLPSIYCQWWLRGPVQRWLWA